MQIILGCDKVLDNGHVDIDSGIFGVLDEKLNKVKTGRIIPAKENTSCRCRRTSKCSMDCHNSVYGIRVGHRISYRDPTKRM